jgi:flagellar basal body P-ring formation protein FlgA
MPVKALTIFFLWAAALCGFAAHAAAQDAGMQSLASVRQAAERALRRELGTTVTGLQLNAVPLDARLRLPACGAALETQTQAPRANQIRMLVRVACTQGPAWTVNVPVEVHREIEVLVLRRAIARGETPGAGDVVVQKRVIAGLASPFVARIEDLKGRPARRPLPQGTAVTADALTEALLIHRGQDVTLLAAAGGILIRAPGRALADASANQRLRVQNLESLKIVEGVAESDSVVRVNL